MAIVKKIAVLDVVQPPLLSRTLEQSVADFNGKGGIIIIQTDEGNKIAQFGLTPEEIRANLCLAIYYNEKIELDNQ